MTLPRDLQSIISAVDGMTAEFGDAELAKRNRKFDRQYVIAERRSEKVVAVAVFVIVALAVVAVIAISTQVKP